MPNYSIKIILSFISLVKKIVVNRSTLSLFIEKILLAVDESGHQSEFCWVIGYIMVVNRGNCRELNV